MHIKISACRLEAMRIYKSISNLGQLFFQTAAITISLYYKKPGPLKGRVQLSNSHNVNRHPYRADVGAEVGVQCPVTPIGAGGGRGSQGHGDVNASVGCHAGSQVSGGRSAHLTAAHKCQIITSIPGAVTHVGKAPCFIKRGAVGYIGIIQIIDIHSGRPVARNNR